MTGHPPGPGWGRLIAAGRRSLERTGGSLDATVSLSNPTEDERRVIIGITGVYRSATAVRLAVRLRDVDAYLVYPDSVSTKHLAPSTCNVLGGVD